MATDGGHRGARAEREEAITAPRWEFPGLLSQRARCCNAGHRRRTMRPWRGGWWRLRAGAPSRRWTRRRRRPTGACSVLARGRSVREALRHQDRHQGPEPPIARPSCARCRGVKSHSDWVGHEATGRVFLFLSPMDVSTQDLLVRRLRWWWLPSAPPHRLALARTTADRAALSCALASGGRADLIHR